VPVATVEWGKLVQVVYVSLILGVGVVALYAIGVYAASRAAEARRSGDGSAGVYGIMAAVSMTAFLAVVVFAITVILNKS
jgi:hypothetical protein